MANRRIRASGVLGIACLAMAGLLVAGCGVSELPATDQSTADLPSRTPAAEAPREPGVSAADVVRTDYENADDAGYADNRQIVYRYHLQDGVLTLYQSKRKESPADMALCCESVDVRHIDFIEQVSWEVGDGQQRYLRTPQFEIPDVTPEFARVMLEAVGAGLPADMNGAYDNALGSVVDADGRPAPKYEVNGNTLTTYYPFEENSSEDVCCAWINARQVSGIMHADIDFINEETLEVTLSGLEIGDDNYSIEIDRPTPELLEAVLKLVDGR